MSAGGPERKADRDAEGARQLQSLGPTAQRGSLVVLKQPLFDQADLAIVISNDIQNREADYLAIVPLQRRTSRLEAPFAVDLGRGEGFRELYTARCDWLTRIWRGDLKSIERSQVGEFVMHKLERAISVALAFSGTL